MQSIELGLSLVGLTILLIALRIPVGIAMFVCGAGGFSYILGPAVLSNWLKGLAYGRFSNFDLIVIPMFVLMGQFATHGGLSQLLFRFVSSLVGHYRGGVAYATIGACAAFGAICGSSVATAATMGQVAGPEMQRLGYSGRLTTGSIAAGGTLGILIPPSIPLVVYALLTGESIGHLFIATIIPATIATVGYLIATRISVVVDPSNGPAGPRSSWADLMRSAVSVAPVGLVFFVVVVGIYGGWASPTEASAIGAVACGALAFAHGMRLTGFFRSLLDTARTSAMIYLILLGADMLNAALALTGMTNGITAWLLANDFSPLVILVFILIIYLLLGCVMESMSMIMLTIPIFYPMIMALDFWGMAPQEKSIWFGVLALMVVEIGLITPPVGIVLYVVNALVPGISMSTTFRGVMPYLVSDIARILAVVFIPSLTLLLLRL